MKKIKIPSEGTWQKVFTVKELFGGTSPAVIAKSTATGALYCAAGFVLGRTPLLFDAFPMGLALLCAAEKKALWILLGLVASTFSVEAQNTVFSPVMYIFAYLFAYVLRFAALMFADRPEGFRLRDLFSERIKETFSLIFRNRYTESLSLRMSCASISALTVGIYMLRAGQYRYYDLFGALFMILASPTFTFLYSGAFEEETEDNFQRIMRRISACTLLFSCVYALRETSLLGVSLAVFASYFSVMYTARRRMGLLLSLLTAFSAGMAVSPSLAPAFMLSSAVLNMTREKMGTSNILLSVAAGLLWGGFIDGVGGITHLLPGFLTAALAESAFDALTSLSEAKKESDAIPLTTTSAKERLEQLSETFMSLSKKLSELSGMDKRPSPVETRGLCLDCAENLCRDCSKDDECHTEKNYGVLSERIETVFSQLMKKGRVEKDELPEHLTESCHRWEQLLHDSNTAYASLLREAVMRDKIELFALDYEAVSRIISEAAQAESEENARNSALETQIIKFSRKNGLGFDRVAAYGERNPHIVIGKIGRTAQEMKTSRLRQLMGEACGFPVTQPVFNIRGGDISMSFEADQRFSAQVGFACEGVGGQVCGDTVDSFRCGNRVYTLISDGMGSGESAAAASGICREFLCRMLEGNNRKETAARMLGTVLRSKGDECSATVDLAELDTVTGELSFLKSGATSSFVKRGEKLFSLSAKTMPVGILRGYDGEVTKFIACDGDVAILVSDGVSSMPECCLWLTEMLGGGDEFFDDPEKAARAIVCEARRRGSADDISAAVIKISKTA